MFTSHLNYFVYKHLLPILEKHKLVTLTTYSSQDCLSNNALLSKKCVCWEWVKHLMLWFTI